MESDLRVAIISADPRGELLKHYLTFKTKASFQGSGDIKTRVRNALGINSTRITDSDLESLDDFFQARNSIVHGMDYENPKDSKRTKRVHRHQDEVISMCDNAFSICADLLHAAAEVILTNR